MREVDKDITRDVLELLYSSFKEDGPAGDVVDSSDILDALDYDDDDVRYVLRRMDGSQMINYKQHRGMSRVQLLPRGIEEFDDIGGETIVSDELLDEVFGRIYEADMNHERLTKSELEDIVGSGERLDRFLWYLDNKGYIETARMYRVPHVTELGRRMYERD